MSFHGLTSGSLPMFLSHVRYGIAATHTLARSPTAIPFRAAS